MNEIRELGYEEGLTSLQTEMPRTCLSILGKCFIAMDQYSPESTTSPHRAPAGLGRVGEPRGPSFSPVPPLAGSRGASGPRRYLGPSGSSLEDSRCSEAACPE